MLNPHVQIFLENAGPFTFLCLQISSLSTAFKIWSDKSVGSMSIVPFISLFVNCVVWSVYGLLIDEAPIYAPNICGMVTGAVCTFVFQAHYPFFNAMLYFQGVVVIALCLAAASQDYRQVVGAMGSCLSISVMASPLAVIQTVVRDKSTAALPFTTSLVLFSTGLCWSLYGWLVIDDISVYLPNALGLLLASVQLSLFVVYGFPPPATAAVGGGGGLIGTLFKESRSDVLPYSVLKLED